jgi:hypothetical protein
MPVVNVQDPGPPAEPLERLDRGADEGRSARPVVLPALVRSVDLPAVEEGRARRRSGTVVREEVPDSPTRYRGPRIETPNGGSASRNTRRLRYQSAARGGTGNVDVVPADASAAAIHHVAGPPVCEWDALGREVRDLGDLSSRSPWLRASGVRRDGDDGVPPRSSDGSVGDGGGLFSRPRERRVLVAVLLASFTVADAVGLADLEDERERAISNVEISR